MTNVQKDTQRDGYLIPAPLVNKAIISIIGSIFLIGAYMVVWAVNDASFKARVLSAIDRIPMIEARMQLHMDKPCHDVACVELEMQKRQLDREVHEH